VGPKHTLVAVPSRLVAVGQVFALCGFAFAQPVFDLLGNNPTFFVAHGSGRFDVILFTVALLLVPPALLCAGLALLRQISPQAARVTFVGLIGVLAALAIVPMVDRTTSLSTAVYVVLLLAVGAGAVWAYVKAPPVRMFVSWLIPAPLLFAGFFLVGTPVSNLVFSDDPEAAATAVTSDAPVVWLLFDEFPLGPMLDPDGRIDGKRFPNFARLAEISNWYPRAASVARNTFAAVPAMLSGTIPGQDPVPIAAEFPRNLFTMLGRSRDLHVDELLQMCPRSLCEGASESGDSVGRRQLVEDTGIAFLHTLLPTDLADQWLPAIGDRWAGFGDEGLSFSSEGIRDEDDALRAAREAREALFYSFGPWLRSLGERTERPGLWFHHLMLPHVPYRLLPDGTRYDAESFAPGVGDDGQRSPNQYLSDLSRQQFVLQAGYADAQLGRVLNQLERSGTLEETLLVVVADHGVSFKPGGTLRAAEFDRVSRHETMPVPMFVKLPGQTTGKTDTRVAQIVDLLPTVADALGIELGDDWSPDGRSLLGDESRTEYVYADEFEGRRVPPPDARKVAAEFADALGLSDQTHDLYRVRPYGALVGQPIDAIPETAERSELDLTFDQSALDPDPATGRASPRFVASVSGGRGDEWVAVVVNGVVAATAQVADLDGSAQIIAMIDPTMLRDGHNEIEIREIVERDDATIELARLA
jgi:hypothetical protein